MSKIAERIIDRKIHHYSDELDMLPEEQFGLNQQHYNEQ